MTIFVRNENNNKFFSEFSDKLNEAERNLGNPSFHYECSKKNEGFVVNNLGEDFAVKCKDAGFVATLRRSADKLLKCVQKQVDSWPCSILIGESNLEYVQELQAALQVCQNVERISKNVLAKHLKHLQRAKLPKSNCAFNLEKTTKKFAEIKKVLVRDALYSFYCPLAGYAAEVPKSDLFINEPFLLHGAIKNHAIPVAQNLLKLGFNPDIADKNGETPFMLACKNKLDDFAIELIEKGFVNIEAVDDIRESPFVTAWKHSRSKIVLKLLEKGADFSKVLSNGKTLLHASLEANMPRVAQSLIALGADIHKRDQLGQTPLLCACKKNCVEGALILIEKGADINLIDESGRSLLLLACNKKMKDVALKLIARGLDINSVDNRNNTPLLVACTNKMKEVVYLLLEKGADVNIANASRNTVLISAFEVNDEELVLELLARGANINVTDNSGNTPFILACKKKMFTAIEQLLEMNIDIMTANNFGETGLHWAYQASEENHALQTFVETHFLEIFAQSSEMRLGLQQVELLDIPRYFAERPQLLVKEAKQNKINPLEVVFFFLDIELARALAPHLGRSRYKSCLDALSNKYPESESLIFKLNLLAHYKINPEHIKNVKITKLPEKAEGVEVRDLLAIFDSLNLFDPNAANYVNPAPLLKEITTINSQTLRGGLLQFIEKVEDKQAYLGTPRADRVDALNDFYAKIEAALTNVIKKLNSLEDSQENTIIKARVLCTLCDANERCGGRLFTDSIQQYETVVVGKSPDFADAISEDLATQRLTLVSSVLMANNNVHTYNYLLRFLGKELGLPNAAEFENFDDPIPPGIVIDTDAAKRLFFKHYTPYAIVQDQVWPSLSVANAGVFRDNFDEWWKNNIPEQWAKKKYTAIKRRLNELKRRGISDTEIAYTFEKNFQIKSNDLIDDLQPKESMKLAQKLQWAPHPLDTRLYYIKQRFKEFKDANASAEAQAFFLESHGIQVANNQNFEDAINSHNPNNIARSNKLRLNSIERVLDKLMKCNLSNELLKSFLYSHNIPVSLKECPNDTAIEDIRKRDFVQRVVYIGNNINKNAVINMLERQGVLAPALSYNRQGNIQQAAENKNVIFFFNS